MLKETITIKTVSLDHFIAVNHIPAVDFIKIDIQGAELDVFQGGVSALKNVLAIMTEVEFFPLYENQPLFGDVYEFLVKSDFIFHKFMSLSGRSLKPTVFNNNPNFATQHMWADAMFLKEPARLGANSPRQLLKLAILAAMYGSPDVSVYCLQEYDRRQGTGISRELMSYFHGDQNAVGRA
ncbi:MAG: FkbM family methyltransferase [Gammaproteobacteria bacterium]|nr:FkbM family methyltransferase [Gammaproteobacteria bacterium]